MEWTGIQEYADQGVQTIRHQRQSGVGAAIRTAIKYARQKGYEILVIMAGARGGGAPQEGQQEVERLKTELGKEVESSARLRDQVAALQQELEDALTHIEELKAII